MSTQPTAGQLLKQLAEADNKVASARGVLKQREQEYEAVADQVFALMDAQETETIRNSSVGLQVTIGESEYDVIEDYEAFVPFVLRHKLVQFFQRRLTPKALEEWREAHPGKKIPGLGTFKRRRLHVTSIK